MKVNLRSIFKYLFILSFLVLSSNCGNGTTGPSVGPVGPQGPAGVNGQPCTVTEESGGALITCSDGTTAFIANGSSGATGAQGPPGDPGSQGPAGNNGTSCSVSQQSQGALITCTDGTSALILNGTNGQNGTVIQPIQFCAGVTPIYPSAFPEFGFCIDGVIWGIYSENDGFLANYFLATTLAMALMLLVILLLVLTVR